MLIKKNQTVLKSRQSESSLPYKSFFIKQTTIKNSFKYCLSSSVRKSHPIYLCLPIHN